MFFRSCKTFSFSRQKFAKDRCFHFFHLNDQDFDFTSQCDQIELLFKGLNDKFSCLYWATFWAVLKNRHFKVKSEFGYFVIQHLVTLMYV